MHTRNGQHEQARQQSPKQAWGDQQAFEQIYILHRQSVYRFLASRYGSLGHHELEEIVQEVFARAWGNREKFQGQCSPTTYLFAVAGHIAVDRVRHRRTVECANNMLTEDRRNEPGPSKANERLELVAIARRELAALSDRQREVMELMCIERLAAGEVAKRMGSTVKAVYRLVEKGRRRMLSRLAACGMRSGETTGKKHDCPACALRMWCTKWLLLNEF